VEETMKIRIVMEYVLDCQQHVEIRQVSEVELNGVIEK
jgi:hypothetical protein